MPNDYTNPPSPTPATPFPTANIVLLTDGTCSSACSLFIEMMTQAGVRTIVMGGSPVNGPMQAASGSRGAVVYSATFLDYDIEQAADILAKDTATAAAAAQLPNRDDTGVNIKYASLTLRDQVRPNDSVPLQFQYLPASCRLFYTLDNVFNMDRLWRDVAAAAWDDGSMCVTGSTSSGTTTHSVAGGAVKPPVRVPSPVATAVKPPLGLSSTTPSSTDASSRHGGLEDGESFVPKSADMSPCHPNAPSCQPGTTCKAVRFGCDNGFDSVASRCLYLCVSPCSNLGWPCPPSSKERMPLSCGYETNAAASVETVKNLFRVENGRHITRFEGARRGSCVPEQGSTKLCSLQVLKDFACKKATV